LYLYAFTEYKGRNQPMGVKEAGKEHRRRPPAQQDGLYGSTGPSGLVFRKTLVQTLTILVIVSLALLAGRMIHVLLLFFAGILLAVLLDFFGRQLMRLPRMPHWLAITIVLIVLTILSGLIVVLVIPSWPKSPERWRSKSKNRSVRSRTGCNGAPAAVF
jgi:ABC-type dipeptide/oligopeptide/nickel transport system permease subunit